MGVLRDYQDAVFMQSNIDAAQYSSLAARALDAWNEWEINCLVMASFSLQVFLLLSAPFRKRHRSTVLSGSLWLAYLLADYVATYVLGRLTLLLALAGNERRHQLALFWAPFLLLHLGGQETITAFSMEDNTLWKRRLLDLAAQAAMAVYVVGKQWRGGDRLLVAPMVLMFVSEAVKYGERVWALRAAAERAPGSRRIARLAARASSRTTNTVMYHYETLVNISSQDKIRIERVLEEASIEFPASLDFFMDVTPSKNVVSGFSVMYDEIKSALMDLKSSKNGDGMAYKLAEVQVSLIYDYLYTKFGTVRFQAPKSNPIIGAALQWLGSLSLTFMALVLYMFAWAMGGSTSGADVLISYILLVGAIVMEIFSIFIALISSCWAGTGVAKHLHLHNVGEWSGKLAQYNMVDAFVQERERKSAAGVIGSRAIRWMLASSSKTPPHVVVSPEVKKLLLNKVLEIATDLRSHIWDFSRFQGQWAQWVADRVAGDRGSAAPAYKALLTSKIQELDFVPSVILWHLVTSICLLAGDGPGEFTNPSKELSNYIMYLVAKRSVMVDSDGHMLLSRTLMEVKVSFVDILRDVEIMPREVPDFLDEFKQEESFIRKLREGDKEYESLNLAVHQRSRAPTTARRVCVELLKIPEARDRWELIAAVWTEILCYMALNCGAAFHAKHLTTGGEFLTQAKMLLFVIRLPFLRNSLSSGVTPDDIYEL